MEKTYRTVRLTKNRSYPTYQLCAQMASKKTKPADGLRFAALTTLQWVKRRLCEHVPTEWEGIPEPEQYLAVGDDCLFSQHINEGYVIDIVSLPEHGIWSIQITEPDLGPDPGRSDQQRPPVAGRVIETNVAFRILDRELHCGFQTVISDPEGTEQMAEVYRLAIVRLLASAPMFGLKQITPLNEAIIRISRTEQVDNLIEVWHHAENQLPCVMFAQTVEEPPKESPPAFTASVPQISQLHQHPTVELSLSAPKLRDSRLLSLLDDTPVSRKKEKKPVAPVQVKTAPKINDPPYDISRFAKYSVTLCRTYLLEEKLRKRFEQLSGLKVNPGDILVLEPDAFGGSVRTIPMKPSEKRQKQMLKELRNDMFTYPRGKAINFGRIVFLTMAHQSLLRQTDDLERQSKDLAIEWQQRVTMLQLEWKAEIKAKDIAYEELSDRLDRAREYGARLEVEKIALREQQVAEIERYQQLLTAKDEDIRYLRRKLTQPTDHAEIAEWVKSKFSGRLFLHPKAIDLLTDRSAKVVDAALICDALDFLATDYWERRYQQISESEMLTRCSEKYGRPFDVAPTGSMAVEMMPGDYKIKYFSSSKGKARESALDYHLRVGNDSENLLRIYFLHDDEKQLIVIGSLPRHLRTVKFQ